MFLVLTILSLLFFTNGVHNQEQSPCPDVFSYDVQRAENDKWYGSVYLRTADDLTGVWLTVQLDRPAELLGNWFGETYTTDNQSFRISNSDYKLEAGPPVTVVFFIQYDPSKPIPNLKLIRLNGRTICSEKINENDLRPTTPKLHISHQVRPTSRPVGFSRPGDQSRPNVDDSPIRQPEINRYPDNTGDFQGNSEDVDDFQSTARPTRRTTRRPTKQPAQNFANFNSTGNFQGEFEDTFDTQDISRPATSPTRRPTRRPTQNSGSSSSDESPNAGGLDYFPGDFSATKKPAYNRSSSSSDQINNSQSTLSCGTVATRPAPLISNGQDTVPGQWPWHAAVYHSKGIQLIYICGATLVSERYLLTAAHCVTKPNTNKPVDTESILIYLGKYNLVTFGSEVQDRDISDIYVNPEYNHTLYFNDIAILKMSRAADVNNYVRPCCLWEDDNTNLEGIIGRQGTVVGWGFDKNKKLTNELMQAHMPVVSTLNCIMSNRDFFSQFMSDRNFCAGFRNGTSVCNGDSGGSMVFARRGSRGQNTVWQIRGIVSVGVALHDEGVCDTSQFVIFTDVAKYLGWIRQIVFN